MSHWNLLPAVLVSVSGLGSRLEQPQPQKQPLVTRMIGIRSKRKRTNWISRWMTTTVASRPKLIVNRAKRILRQLNVLRLLPRVHFNKRSQHHHYHHHHPVQLPLPPPLSTRTTKRTTITTTTLVMMQALVHLSAARSSHHLPQVHPNPPHSRPHFRPSLANQSFLAMWLPRPVYPLVFVIVMVRSYWLWAGLNIQAIMTIITTTTNMPFSIHMPILNHIPNTSFMVVPFNATLVLVKS